LMSGTIF